MDDDSAGAVEGEGVGKTIWRDAVDDVGDDSVGTEERGSREILSMYLRYE